MKLYQTPRAPNPERVTQFLKIKDRLHAVELVELSIMEQDHRKADYREVSPFSQVPALVLDDGTSITESRAICTFFEGLFPDPNLMGVGPKEKALIEMWDRRIELMFMLQYALWFRNAHPAMAELEKPQSQEAAAKGERNAKWFAKQLDKHLAENEWLTAGRFTIADLTLKITCEFTSGMRWKPHTTLENLGAWFERASAKVPG